MTCRGVPEEAQETQETGHQIGIALRLLTPPTTMTPVALPPAKATIPMALLGAMQTRPMALMRLTATRPMELKNPADTRPIAFRPTATVPQVNHPCLTGSRH